MPRAARLVFDVAAQPDDEVVDRAGVGVLVQRPRPPREWPCATPACPSCCDEIAQQRGFHQRQRHASCRRCALRAARNRCVRRETRTGRSRAARRLAAEPMPEPLAAAQQPADARDENRQLERLRQVVVGAGLETAAARPPDRPRAVSIRTGTNCRCRRSSATTAKPSMPGSMTSRMTRS